MSFTELNKYATKYNDEFNKLPSTLPDKITVLFLNWSSPKLEKLGQPVINDGVLMAKLCKQFGYTNYYICDATVDKVKSVLAKLFSMLNKHVIYYYSGHGEYTTDDDGDESDGFDENFVFCNGYLKDDDMIDIINKNLKCNHLSLIADCCYAGTIFDLERLNNNLKNKVSSISACNDKQMSTQSEENGLFTLQLTKLCNQQTGIININELNKRLKEYDQTVITYGDINKLFVDNKQRGVGTVILDKVFDKTLDRLIDAGINTGINITEASIRQQIENKKTQKLVIQKINVK